VSGVPEDSNSNSPPSGISRGTRAIIHRTVRCTPDTTPDSVRCTPDSVRCAKGERPQELASFGNLQRLVRYNSPDMSGVHRTVRCNSAPTATCGALNARAARAEVRRAHTGTPDSKQYMSGVHRTSRQAHKSEAPNGRNPTKLVTWLGHRTVRCAIDRQPPPMVKFGGWGYKYPNHPTIHCIQVLQLSTTIQELAFIAKHTKRDQILSQLHTKL
jgi:hypothetical protein